MDINTYRDLYHAMEQAPDTFPELANRHGVVVAGSDNPTATVHAVILMLLKRIAELEELVDNLQLLIGDPE
jgi:hypothetical protein